ncbi:MAG: hypothetical protein LLG01_00850 [Planctomycetaceae bacterium]|nr:hypothetical protein [Planctomycetaceae bacterium]
MPQKSRLGVARTFYVPEDIADGFKAFVDELISEKIRFAMISYAALVPEARDRIDRETSGLPWEQAVRVARRIIEEAALNEYRARYVKSLPAKKQLELFEKVKK